MINLAVTKFNRKMPKNIGGRPITGTKMEPVINDAPTLAELGITKTESSRAQKVADKGGRQYVDSTRELPSNPPPMHSVWRSLAPGIRKPSRGREKEPACRTSSRTTAVLSETSPTLVRVNRH